MELERETDEASEERLERAARATSPTSRRQLAALNARWEQEKAGLSASAD